MLLRTLIRWQAAQTNRPLPILLQFMANKETVRAADYFEKTFLNVSSTMPITKYSGRLAETRDVVAVMFRVYTALGKVDKLRQLFAVAVRDLHTKGLLNAAVFEHYLEMLTKRKGYNRDEVLFVLKTMEEHNIEKTPLTYLYLIELHLRIGVDPAALWNEMEKKEAEALEEELAEGGEVDDAVANNAAGGPRFVLLPRQPLITVGALRAMMIRVLPTIKDQALALRVVKRLLAADRVDRQQFADLTTNWMTNPDVAPEHSQWLLFEFEQRCVLEKAALNHYINKFHIVSLLLRCAKAADAITTERILAFMDRHVITKTADVLALVVWCYALAEEIEKGIDVIELMGRKGHLEFTDPFKKFTVDTIQFTMDRHFLMIMADAMNSAALTDRAFAHAQRRKESGKQISVHSLDVIVLACSKLGDEDRAVETLESYPQLGLQPRTQSYNALLLASVGARKSSVHRTIFDAMVRNGVAPNAHTFRLLIRQAVVSNDIDEAVRFLELVTTFPGLRVEVEMILPILERSARAGDVTTSNKVSKYALDCDIGIDSAVMNNVVLLLSEQGCDVSVIQSHLALHETLRSRSKAARRRVKHDVGL